MKWNEAIPLIVENSFASNQQTKAVEALEGAEAATTATVNLRKAEWRTVKLTGTNSTLYSTTVGLLYDKIEDSAPGPAEGHFNFFTIVICLSIGLLLLISACLAIMLFILRNGIRNLFTRGHQGKHKTNGTNVNQIWNEVEFSTRESGEHREHLLLESTTSGNASVDHENLQNRLVDSV